MPQLIWSSETIGCGATIRLDSDDVCVVTVGGGVTVRTYKHGSLFGSLFGSVLYKEKSVYKAATTALLLASAYPRETPLPSLKNPVLGAFARAIWHCSSAAEVCIVLGETSARALRMPIDEIEHTASLIAAFEEARSHKPHAEASTYQVMFSDGKIQDERLMAYEVSTWPVESNRLFEAEQRPYRIIRIADGRGITVWTLDV